jgi:hypothetical protein
MFEDTDSEGISLPELPARAVSPVPRPVSQRITSMPRKIRCEPPRPSDAGGDSLPPIPPAIQAEPDDMASLIERLLQETRVSFQQLSKEEGRSIGWYHRQRLTGSLSQRDSNGNRRRFRLEAYKDGGHYWTSYEAMRRFILRLNSPDAEAAQDGSRSVSQRSRASERAGRLAQELGC